VSYVQYYIVNISISVKILVHDPFWFWFDNAQADCGIHRKFNAIFTLGNVKNIFVQCTVICQEINYGFLPFFPS
jgi:hypothetical protein